MQAVKEEDLGVVDLDEEVERRKCKLYTSNWFSVEVKTGVSYDYMRFGPSQLSCLGSSVGRALCLEYRVLWVRVPPEAAHFF